MSSVAIFLHQQHYTAGDALSGDVVVTVSHPLQAHHVTLFIDGREKVFWEETEMEKDSEGRVKHVKVHRKDSHHFLKEKVILSGAVTLQPGQNTFRFTHRLSSGLPASFLEKASVHAHPVKAKIDYELSAEVDAHHARDLKTHVHLTVGQHTGGPISPVEHTNRKSFMFNQGHLGMRVELDRDVYFPGDEVKMKLEVSNESVTGINVDLRRHMTLRAHHHRFSHSDNAQHLRLEGLAEATKDSRFAKFRIPTDFSRLSTKSDLLQATYDLKVECDVPMAVDLSIIIPLVITVPQHLDLRAKEYSAPHDIEHEEIVRQGDTYHERTPLVLPDKTGDMCACCILS
ncbi:arrestin (or santigen), n-terminal domain containing protein [Acanthamoeba castellanii str. Neff]|uniref:Arrestin (Or santigen), n-terminal domain containing protein n=1 Tax=Acanthamoeba castellanii (strain ATCC 30010 / Neff) TaxID=1257118 RepID=L8H8B9_ACACF|nr:arrestin (or santigen), n-terminal domain containing protein [Acanthamoeba castellanii str. Neff]ELR21749.1 arrestin (or santigen), n-terminal domain containing protein [Acanthamoeba castellanii str. Neff]